MITAITSYFPDTVLSNQELADQFPDWPAEKIFEKTGISQRFIASADECASDLAEKAAQKLFSRESREEIDWLLFCTQTPDYILPTTACTLQHRLGLSSDCAALDFNLGCSGYIYGLSLASALIESGQAKRVLLLTADTYSKLIHHEDKGTRTIFGDAGTATLLEQKAACKVHSFVLGTDGRGEEELIYRNGGSRESGSPVVSSESALSDGLYMNGPEIFNFTLKAVPTLVRQLLQKSKLELKDIDLVVFHQANGFMLEHLRRKLKIPADKFVLHFAHCGNTVSSTIPIVIEELIQSGRLRPGMKVILAGFGVGFSWGGCILEW